MKKTLDIFPITGRAVCDVLVAELGNESTCLLKDIETLCSSNCEALGDLWQKVVSSRAEVIKVADLVSALKFADQIVCLDLCSVVEPQKSLFIEDGELVEYKF
ncbi:hypothetical protein [Chitinivorax sp. B]|uniref:hypothetical protein n=1 Tax=Chitinivorax sp. B TaxID=2502235 RepID=UPI0010F7D46F|nr:hypothetical protein [Chitinivorax sp. B]